MKKRMLPILAIVAVVIVAMVVIAVVRSMEFTPLFPGRAQASTSAAASPSASAISPVAACSNTPPVTVVGGDYSFPTAGSLGDMMGTAQCLLDSHFAVVVLRGTDKRVCKPLKGTKTVTATSQLAAWCDDAFVLPQAFADNIATQDPVLIWLMVSQSAAMSAFDTEQESFCGGAYIMSAFPDFTRDYAFNMAYLRQISQAGEGGYPSHWKAVERGVQLRQLGQPIADCKGVDQLVDNVI